MAYYPYFDNGGGTTTNNTTALYLSTSRDNAFDVYKFADADGIESVFMLFIIKNTHINTSSALNITSILGNAAFNHAGRFTINPTDSLGNLLIGLPGSNKAITPVNNSISSVNVSGVSTPPTDSTGASAYIGHPGTVSNDAANGLNASNSSFLVPLYHTDDIINQPILYNQYASFIVKFTPDVASNSLDVDGETPQLYIRNNDTDLVIDFAGSIINPLDYYGVVGTAISAGGGGTDDSFESDYTTFITDGDTFDIGIFPTGYNYGTENKTIRFYDYSEQPGNFTYQVSSGPMNISPYHTLSAEGVTNVVSANIYTSYAYNFYYHFQHRAERLSSEIHCADNISSGLDSSVNGTIVGKPYYKNFSQRDNSTWFRNHPSNIVLAKSGSKWVGEPIIFKHAAGLSEIEKFGAYQIKNIVNNQSQIDTDDLIFQFGVRVGYYHPFTFSEKQCDVWTAARQINSAGTVTSILSNVHALPIDAEGQGPRIASTNPNFALSRKGKCPFNVAVRFNYFHEGNATGAPFTLPSFYFENTSIKTSQSTSVTKPISYSVGTDITEKSHIYQNITGATAVTQGETSTMFDSKDAHGEILKLHYEVEQPSFRASYMYDSSSLVDGILATPVNEGQYGLFFNAVTFVNDEFSLFDTVFRDSDSSVNDYGTQHQNSTERYEYGFYPEYSYARLLSTNSDGVKTRAGNQTPNPECKLFYDGGAGVYDETDYAIGTEKIFLENSNDWYPANATAADQNMSSNTDQQYVDNGPDGDKNSGVFESGWDINDVIANEGQWYGAGIVSYLRPHAWGFEEGRFFNNGIGSMKGQIDHNLYDNKRRGVSGVGEPRWHEEDVDYWFKLPAASYNPSVGKFRAAGRLYIDNTGDYPIFMHQIEVKQKNFYLANDKNNVTFKYQQTKEALLPKSYDPNDPDTQVFAGYTPTSNSNTPSWGISRGRYHGDQQENIEVWEESDHSEGLGLNSNLVAFGRHIDEDQSMSAEEFYITRNNMYEHSSNVRSNFSEPYPTNDSDERVFVIEPQIENDHFVRSSNESHGVLTGAKQRAGGPDMGHMNYFDVVFELTPTGTSSDDNGMYYAQVCMTYYVNDYDSRRIHHTNGEGIINSNVNQSVGQNHNAHTRLRVSKYLVGVQVETLAEITVVDSESDKLANKSTINIGDISVA